MAKIYRIRNNNITGQLITWQIAKAAQVEWLIICRDQAGTIQKRIMLKPTSKPKKLALLHFLRKAAQTIRGGFTEFYYQKRKVKLYQRFLSTH